MIDDDFYRHVLGIPRYTRKGGQELILGECAAALFPYATWFPFPHYCETLINYYASERVVMEADAKDAMRYRPLVTRFYSGGDGIYPPRECQAVYLGTPTIIANAPLFKADEDYWTAETERQMVKFICSKVVAAGYRRIVTGLGTGDISVDERLEDMGGGKVACMKDFGGFQDYVLVRDIGIRESAVTSGGQVTPA